VDLAKAEPLSSVSYTITHSFPCGLFFHPTDEAGSSSETAVIIYQTTHHNSQEDSNLQFETECAVSRHRISVAAFHVSPATALQINLLVSFPGSSATANMAVAVPSFPSWTLFLDLLLCNLHPSEEQLNSVSVLPVQNYVSANTKLAGGVVQSLVVLGFIWYFVFGSSIPKYSGISQCGVSFLCGRCIILHSVDNNNMSVVNYQTVSTVANLI
jgi:hypothetical protein